MANDLRPDVLQTKPMRNRGKRGQFSLVLIGGVMIVGVCIVLVGAWLWKQNASSSASPTTGTDTATNTKLQGPYTISPEFWRILESQFAQGVHLSVDQVKAKLRANVSIADIANQQGLTQQELHTLEVKALQLAHDKLVAQGNMTKQDADKNMAWWKGKDPKDLNENFKNWFLEH